jgi:hypothetical protein
VRGESLFDAAKPLTPHREPMRSSSGAVAYCKWVRVLSHKERAGAFAPLRHGSSPRRQRREDISKSEGCGAPSGRVLFLWAASRRPAERHRFRPLSPLTTCSAGLTARRYGRESSNSGGRKEAARGGPLLRPRGLIATRSRKWLPPLAVILERRGPTPHDRDGLGHASLMGQGWEEFNGGAEGGDIGGKDRLSIRTKRSASCQTETFQVRSV